MKDTGTSTLATGVFLATYSLITWVYPQGVAPEADAPSAVRMALRQPETRVALATAALPQEVASMLPASAPVPVPAPADTPRKTPTLPRIVAVDRRIAERTDQLQPNVKKRLAHVARELPDGVTLLVTSAYRTSEEQAALTPTFGIKAAPGTSTHEHGRGIDLNVLVDGERVPPRDQQQVIGEVMADAGFRHLGPADPVHYSIPEWELGPDPAEEPWLDVPTLDEAWSEIAETTEANPAERPAAF